MNHVPPKNAAVNLLLEDNPLKTVIGPGGNYEVRTSMFALRSCCRVYHNGLEMPNFPPVILDLSRRTRNISRITREVRTQLAQSIAQAHFKRCEEVKQYVELKNEKPKQRKKIILRTAFGAALFIVLILGSLAFLVKNGSEISLLPAVSWPASTLSTHCEVSSSCVIELPELKKTWLFPQHLSIENKRNFPSWLTFDADALRLSGMVPADAPVDTYLFSIRSKATLRAGSLLHIELHITKEAPSSEWSGISDDNPISFDSSTPKVDSECLQKKLLGEPCD